jgi:bacillithiol biosynthesis cysteine-adding enzyme BshC
MKVSFRDIPGMTGLFRDYLYDFDRVRDFYPRAPYDEKGYKALFGGLERRSYHRGGLADVLREQNAAFGNHPSTTASIEKLRDSRTLVIFTGQQAGLFGGPLYTLYKAMTAVNLARYLTMTTPYTFLPLFWVEGEDHDFEEVQTAWVMGRDGEPVPLRYEPQAPFAGQCVGGMVLDGGIDGLIARYEEIAAPSDFRDGVVEALRDCYRPGRTLAEAFSRWMARLMGQYGLILVDPSHPRLKEMALPVLLHSLKTHGNGVDREMARVSARLQERGYHAQVGHRPDVLDFFYHDPARRPFVKEGDGYRLKGTDRLLDTPHLQALLQSEPENFSPNVLLRPQVQDSLFPTAAYVAGPGEIAYFAQFAGIYGIFGTPMPIIYPRKSLTVLEGRTARVLDRYGISFLDVMGSRRDLEMRVLREQIPPSLREALDESGRAIDGSLEILEREAGSFDPNLRPVVKTLRGKVEKELSTARSRIASQMDKKNDVVRGQLSRAIDSLCPGGRLQERRLSVLSFLHKYSDSFIYGLMEQTCCRHESNHILWRLEQP